MNLICGELFASWFSCLYMHSTLRYKNNRLNLCSVFATGDGSCFYQNRQFETETELTGPDIDNVYRVVSDGCFLYTACRDGAVRKYIAPSDDDWNDTFDPGVQNVGDAVSYGCRFGTLLNLLLETETKCCEHNVLVTDCRIRRTNYSQLLRIDDFNKQSTVNSKH